MAKGGGGGGGGGGVDAILPTDFPANFLGMGRAFLAN